MAVTVNTTLAGPLTARFSNIYGALANLGLVSGLGAQDVTGSSDPVAPILNASTFYAPLTHSLVLTRGTGNPTCSRATVGWEFDNEGKLILVPSGAARFGGARMVWNYLAKSEDFSDALWASGGITPPTISANSAIAPDGNATADKISFENAKPIIRQIGVYPDPIYIGNIYTFSCYVKAAPSNAATHVRLTTNNTLAWNTGESTKIALTSEWQRVEVTWTQVTNTWQYLIIGAYNKTGALDADCYGDVLVWGAQAENVTGQADQTASEYVSVGVLSAPYHGAGVDGVKYFNTNKDGSTISASSLLGYHSEGARTNSLLYSRDLQKAWVQAGTLGSELAPAINDIDATGYSWGVTGTSFGSTLSDASGKLRVTKTQAVGQASVQLNGLMNGVPVTIGKTYTVTVTTGTKTGSGNWDARIGTTNEGTQYLRFNTLTDSSSQSGTFVATTTIAYVSLMSSGGASGDYNDWAGVTIKEAAIQVSTCTGLDNAANSASTLTAGAADATILQTLTMAAAARSFSAYVKRRTGSGNVYITRDGGTNWTDITSEINSSTWTRVKIENTSVLNPSVGFKIATSGDAIDVDVCQDEAGAFASSPIITTTAAVTRNADLLTYPKASNLSDAAGTGLISWRPYYESTGNFLCDHLALIVDVNGRICYGVNGQAQTNARAYDGTNILSSTCSTRANGTHRKQATAWGTNFRTISEGAVSVSSGNYDGSMGAGSTIQFNDSNGSSYVKGAYIWSTALTDAQLQQVTA